MPEEKKAASPSPGFLERLFGSQQFNPKIQDAIRLAKKEAPNMPDPVPYGPISRMFMGSAGGYTTPSRNIYLNQNLVGGLPTQEIVDTLLHENQHVNQMNQRGLGPTATFLNQIIPNHTPYGQRPNELEAFQVERDRKMKMGRAPAIGEPSFTNPGQYNYRGNIFLPKE